MEKNLKVLNKKGIHARTAALITQKLEGFDVDVSFCYKEQRVNAKSILGLMLLSARSGAVVFVEAKGPDAPQALEVLDELFLDKFGEA